LNYKYNLNMDYSEKEFHKKDLLVHDKKITYYISPVLENNNFVHAFFTKNSSDIDLKYISNQFQKNYKNCFNKQIHSNKIIFGSDANKINPVIADGIVSDQVNQNLWIYTADCMPILVADFKNKIVASLHCGRKGLEKKIIKKLITLFKNLGCNSKNLLVAVGPSISSKKYVIDKDLFNQFLKNMNSTNLYFDDFQQTNLSQIGSNNKIELDLKKHAYFQLLKENINPENIDISNKCTYSSNREFHSYRKTKTKKRQWSFISN
tara:strand:- start:2096 stop:2884 length:789 start_codon:yes stop_codon:yes gene_type:complete